MSDWQHELVRRVDSLGRHLEGRLILQPADDAEVVPAERFFDAEYLGSMVAAAASPGQGSDEGADLRAVVSRLVRHYAGSLSITALVAMAEGLALDMPVSRCGFVMFMGVPYRLVIDLVDDDARWCIERPTPWLDTGSAFESVDDMRAHVWRRLYVEHLNPFVEHVAETTEISPALLWTNAAEWVGVISEAASEYLDEDGAAPYVADRDVLLSVATLPGSGDVMNPVHDRLYWEPVEGDEFPHQVAVRRLCCLTYLLEDRFGRLCANCPHLPLEDKVALIRERHGVPVGVPGGEAEKRSIERGLNRPSMKASRMQSTRRRKTENG